LEVDKETLKGHIEFIILSLLALKDMYGYEIAKMVREISRDQFELKEGTLYLALKRIQKNELIESYWGEDQGQGARRKYYKILPLGREHFERKKVEWIFVRNLIDLFVERGESQNAKD